MPRTQLAAQLYTIRDFIQNERDFAASMRKLRAIGYRAVQLSALGKIKDRAVKGILADNDLRVCNTHVAYERLRDDLNAVIAQHELWGCRHIAIGSMPPAFRGSAAGYREFAHIASGIGAKLAAAGMSFSYHNHSFELRQFEGRSGLDILFAESDPRYLQAELDTYWLQHGGADPVAWIERMQGRMPVIHLKDMTMLPRADGQPEPAMAEVGAGNMNFTAILAACQRASVEWYAVEQDFCTGDPFTSLAISYRNLLALGLY